MTENPLRAIPSVSEMLAHPRLAACAAGVPRSLLVSAVRAELAACRADLGNGRADEPIDLSSIVAAIEHRATEMSAARLPTVINGTGILLHTGLGRAPLAESAVRAVAEAAANYVPLEIDQATGKRGSRNAVVYDQLCRLTGAEAACVVNNGAAALVLTLATVAAGKDVIVSRGELIEIGGGFRLPQIMQTSGARLVEVGTTNRTRREDYERAIDDTGAVLKVHPSNFRVTGFTHSVPTADLATLARQREIPLVYDIGSGALADMSGWGLATEPYARAEISAGADIVLFSGDKLLGGPQAGIIVGRMRWIEQIARHPLMRAMRVDKLTLAALTATLAVHEQAENNSPALPVFQLAMMPLPDLRRRAERIANMVRPQVAGCQVDIAVSEAYLGGGSLPGAGIASVAITLDRAQASADELATRLRTGQVPVMPRIAEQRVWIDLRSVLPSQDDDLIAAVTIACQ